MDGENEGTLERMHDYDEYISNNNDLIENRKRKKFGGSNKTVGCS